LGVSDYVRRALLVAILVLLLLADCAGVSSLLAIGGLGFAFAVVGRGGVWVPSVLALALVDAILIWLTVVVLRHVCDGR
jgi:hypothetical protein